MCGYLEEMPARPHLTRLLPGVLVHFRQVSLTWHLLTDSAGVVLSRAAPPVESNLIQKEDTAL